MDKRILIVDGEQDKGGTGLGLAIVKHLSEAMGGVGMRPGEPQGSVFWVSLLDAEQARPGAAAS